MLKIGERLVVRNDLQIGVTYDGIMFHEGMKYFLGENVTVGYIPYKTCENVVNIVEDKEGYLWSESMFLKETCMFCEGYQQEELGAGIREGCTIDDLYEDENCQIIKEDVNNIVTAFMLGRITSCPYFKPNNI